MFTHSSLELQNILIDNTKVHLKLNTASTGLQYKLLVSENKAVKKDIIIVSLNFIQFGIISIDREDPPLKNTSLLEN